MLPWLSSSSIARSSFLIFSNCYAVNASLGKMGALEFEQPTNAKPNARPISTKNQFFVFMSLTFENDLIITN